MISNRVVSFKNAAGAPASGGVPEAVLKALGDLTGTVEQKTAAAIALAEGLGVRLDRLEGRADRMGESLDGARSESFGALVTKHADIDAMRAGKANFARVSVDCGERLVRKSIIVGDGYGGSPTAGYPVAQGRIDGILDIRRPLDLLDVLATEVIATPSNTVEYVRNNDHTNDAAIQSLEGDTKAQQSFSFALESAPVRTYAVFAEASRQVLADAPALRQFIDERLSYNVRELLERQIVAGSSSAVTGLIEAATVFVPSAAQVADRIGQAITAIRAQQAGEVVVILNPADWFNIQAERATGSGEYVSGGWLAPANGPIWGAVVVASASVTAGTGLVMHRTAARLWVRQAVALEVGFTGNQFTQNLLTVLAEMRAAFGILQPGLVLKLDF